MWLPLSTVDGETMGLSFAFPHDRETIYKLPLPVEQHLARPGGAVWTPDLQPGDLVFHRYTIHGGLFEPEPDRLSVEFGSAPRVT